MAKPKKRQEQKPKQPQKPDISFSLPINPRLGKYLPYLLLLLPAALCMYYINYAFRINGYNSFPLDDPWIHLTFARNLAEFGSFSYFKNEVVTAGSTSPLYTFILAAGFFITKNEMMLSFVLGIIFFVLAVLFFYKVSVNEFPKENWLALAALLLLATDRWLNLISASGMETSMYIFILIACYYFYRKRNAIGTGVMLGLALWGRPDALAFIGILAIDYIMLLYFKQKSPDKNTDIEPFTKNELIRLASIAGLIIVLYFAMNLKLAGSIWPNTLDAKLAYYSPEFRSRAAFFKAEVWEYFTEANYSIYIIPFFTGLLVALADSFRRKYNKFLFPCLFVAGLIFLYWYKLPYAHRFGRYLMPVIPFYVLVFLYGTRRIFQYVSVFINDVKIPNTASVILIAATIGWSAYAYYDIKGLYQDNCAHIYARQVATAKWLHDNTPDGSVIATHDVGAIGYYSERKVVDVAGLINPEVIKIMNDRNYNVEMADEMKKQNVSYIAFLKEWYQVVNQNPLFVGRDDNPVETMEVYKFEPGKTHILDALVNSYMLNAIDLLSRKQVAQAVQVLNKMIQLDPQSSYTYFQLANALYMSGDLQGSEQSLKKALEVFPDYRVAKLMLSDILRKQSKNSEARMLLQDYIKGNPADSMAIKRLMTLPPDTTTSAPKNK